MPFSNVLRLICVSGLMASAGLAAPSMTIVSGNGQLIRAQFYSNSMTVLVKDTNGQPLLNAPVSWTVLTGGGLINLPTTSTNSAGIASNTYIAPVLLMPFQTFVQSTIQASYQGASVIFTETAYYVNLSNSVPSVEAILLSPTLGQVLTGAVGEQSSIPVQVQVKGVSGSQTNLGVPNVSISVAPQQSNGSTVACSGPVLTDADGIGTCNVIFGGTPGAGFFAINVGDFQPYGQFTQGLQYQVVRGLPAIVRIVSGDNQIANAGTAVPLPIVAQVTDAGGTAIPGVNVTFTSPAASFTNVKNTSDANGTVSAQVTLGNVVGVVPVQVATAPGVPTLTGQPVTVTFNLNAKVVIGPVTKLGDNQSTIESMAFAAPVGLQVTDTNNNPVANLPVTFALTSGSATLSASSATTDGLGQATVSVTAGSVAGPVVITATVQNTSYTFNLTVLPPGPACSAGSFANGASFEAGRLAPGGIVWISCTGLATGIQGIIVPTLFGPLPRQLAGIQVKFGDVLAPIYYVANTGGQESIAVQAPFEVTPAASVPVTISVGAGTAVGSTTVNVEVDTVNPGLFGTTMSDGKVRAVLARPDGSFVSLENPAHPGETIRMFATGLGAVTPPIPTGGLAPPDSPSATNLPVIVGVNNAGVQVNSATYATNLVGVYEVDFVIPSDVPPGNDVPLAVAVLYNGTLVFGNPSSIPIR